jgi:hypothetical protein
MPAALTAILLEPVDLVAQFPARGWRVVIYEKVVPAPGTIPLGAHMAFAVVHLTAWGIAVPSPPAGAELPRDQLCGPIPLFGRHKEAMPKTIRFYRWVPPGETTPNAELIEEAAAWIREGCPSREADPDMRYLLRNLPGLGPETTFKRAEVIPFPARPR